MKKIYLAILLLITTALFSNILIQNSKNTQLDLNRKAYIQSELISPKHTKAFLKASESGDYELVKKYLELGINPNSLNHENSTALMSASLNGHNRIIKILLKYNANPFLKNKKGWDAKSYAKIQERNEIYALLSAYQKTTLPRDVSSAEASP